MKFGYLIAFFVTIGSIVYSEESEQEPQPLIEVFKEDSELSLQQDQITEKSSHFYFKIGTSIAYQVIGFGGRLRDLHAGYGHDLSFNIKAIPFISTKYIFPSLEYTWLMYDNPFTDTYKYSGIGLEISTVLSKHSKLIPIPNPKIVWGKEYPNGKFSQWSLNIIPTIVFGLLVLKVIEEKTNYIYYSLVPLSSMFEYSFGF